MSCGKWTVHWKRVSYIVKRRLWYKKNSRLFSIGNWSGPLLDSKQPAAGRQGCQTAVAAKPHYSSSSFFLLGHRINSDFSFLESSDMMGWWLDLFFFIVFLVSPPPLPSISRGPYERDRGGCGSRDRARMVSRRVPSDISSANDALRDGRGVRWRG